MKIAAFLPRMPWPLDKGDKLRAYHLLKGLARNHEIYLFALHEGNDPRAGIEVLGEFCREVHIERLGKASRVRGLSRALAKGWPLQAGYFHHPALVEKWRAFLAAHRPGQTFYQLIRSLPYLKAATDIPAVIDYQDAFSLSMARLAGESRPPKSWVWQREAEKVARFETEAQRLSRRQIIISEQDREKLPFEERHNVHVISNGIDLDIFKPREAEKDIDILFAGNMSYRPNITAAKYLVEKIMPIVRELRPKLKIVLAGTRPAAEVRQLAGPNVEVTGYVEDIAAWYARSRMLLAPMQTGAGLQNKILEAMAMELPAIVSEIAAKGLPEKARELVLVEKEPEDYAESVIELLNEENYAAMLGHQGRKYVLAHHNWAQISDAFEKIFTD